MTDVLLLLGPVLLVLLLFLGRRSQRMLAQEGESPYDGPPSVRDDLRRLARGRPTRVLSARWLWEMWNGFIGVAGIGFILYMVFSSAIRDPTVRMIVVVTASTIVAIAIVGLLRRRARKEASAVARARLVTRLQAIGMPDEERGAVVSVAEFFDGNIDPASIGANLEPHPGIPLFRKTLEGIRARPDVQDVLVHVTDADDGDTEWPFSDRVYVLTAASDADVASWMAPLAPDEVIVDLPEVLPSGMPHIELGMKVCIAWWD